jgi:hypothetical protein
MRLNIEDFLRGATAVAQGTLAGKLQARQTAQAQRQQDLQNGLALHQAAEHSDEAAFQQEEANDQYVQQYILPKLTGETARELQKQMTAKQFDRQQRRQQAAARRAAFAPPMLRPFLTPPPGAPPVNTTQPQTFAGPGATPMQGATAGVMPGAANNVQLPTNPPGAAPPPGAMPPAPLAPPALAPTAPAPLPNVGDMVAGAVNPPAVPAPGASLSPSPSPLSPGALSAPGVAPPVAPPAPGVVTPAPSPAAGGTAAPTNGRRFSIPGYAGEFEFKGVTPEQIADFKKRRDAGRKIVDSYNSNPQVKADLEAAWQQLATVDPQDEDELHRANDSLAGIERYRADASMDAQRFGNLKYQQRLAARDRARDAIKDPRTGKDRGVVLLRTALAREADLAKEFPDDFDQNSEGLWASFPDLKKAYDRAQATTDTTDDNKVWKRWRPASRMTRTKRALRPARKWRACSHQYPLLGASAPTPRPSRSTCARRASPSYADQVEKNGLTFGGYRADRAAEDFMKQADNWAKMAPEDQNLWVAHMRDLAQAAGWSQEQLQAIVAPKLADKPLTEYQKKMLDLQDRRIDTSRDQLKVAQDRLKLMREKMDQVGKGKNGASGAIVLRGKQHEIDTLWRAYHDLKKQYGLMDDQITNGTSPAARDARELLKKIGPKQKAFNAMYARVTGVDFDSGAPIGGKNNPAANPSQGSPKPIAQMNAAETMAELAREAAKLARKK